MKEEFNLSDKINEGFDGDNCINTKDVKEFIKKLKDELKFCCPFAKSHHMDCNCKEVCKRINLIAGDKLI